MADSRVTVLRLLATAIEEAGQLQSTLNTIRQYLPGESSPVKDALHKFSCSVGDVRSGLHEMGRLGGDK